LPTVQAIAEDPQELHRSLRDLVAVSMLPAIWMKYDAGQIGESVTEVLVRMLDLEFAHLALRWHHHQPGIDMARTRRRLARAPATAIRDGLAAWLGQPAPSDVVELANPVGAGSVRAVFHPVAVGADAMLVTASRHADFPTAAQQLVLKVVANQAAIAIRRGEAEQALQRLNETLEQRVADEIGERMKVEEAFRQAQKMEAIGQLTGGIAHDFNNLLMAMLGNLNLLSKRLAGDPESQHLIDGTLEAAERGALLTQRLLAFARRQDLRPVAVDVAVLVGGMLEMLRRAVGPMIRTETDFAADLWPARVDPNQLELALLNLAVNARDAMPDGGWLRLSARNATVAAGSGGALAAGDYLCLAVSDTGFGMDETTLARARDPFFTTKELGKGTGLGLSMVDGMAAQLGGALRLASRAGTGTTAELWLPRAEGVPAIVAATVAMPSPEPRPCTVLLVEDDALTSMATADILRDLGHRVVEAASGSTALQILRAGTVVDIVVTDQAMPGMTGTQLAAAIRATWPELPVVLATGYAELPSDGEPELPRLDKPYGQDSLAAAIARLVPAEPAPSSACGRSEPAEGVAPEQPERRERAAGRRPG
jgi:signal transduction histidine kinase/ActR/RegA family two-component response regulator